MTFRNPGRRLATMTLLICLLPGTAMALGSGVKLQNMDRSVHPGDDFYRFVNGAWLDRAAIPADRASYGTFSLLSDRTQRQLREIVLELLDDPVDDEGRQVADLYRSFMDLDTLERRGLQPIQPLLRRIEGLHERDALIALLADLMREGVRLPLALSVARDARHPRQHALYMGQSGLGLPDRDFYLSDNARFEEVRSAYRTHVRRMLALAGYRDADKRADQVTALEARLAASHWTRVASRDREATYNAKDLDALQALAPHMDWSGLFAALGVAPERVIVRQPDALAEAAKLLAETPLETLRAYLSYHTLAAYGSYLSSPFDEEVFAFYGTVLSGTERPRPRWQRALGVVEGGLGDALGKHYVARHFPEAHRARVQRMVDYLLDAYAQSIRNLDWMGEDTREAALDKLSRFNTKIGYPDEWRDYSDIDIADDDLFGNIRRIRLHRFKERIDRLDEPVDDDEWFMTPQTVNAYYNPGANEIVFPAAILQPPFFDADADDAINFGAIGAVIGHEIGHGFDDQGSRFDGEGRMREWWTEQDRARFEERTKALVDQYDAFCPLEEHCLNGALTLGENIGDLGGVGIALLAYRLAEADATRARRRGRNILFHGDLRQPRSTLSGRAIDGFSPEQRFFIGWGQVWAHLWREQALINQLRTGPHAPGEFRTNGVMRNISGWYAAFSVGPEHALYLPPEERVRIWQD